MARHAFTDADAALTRSIGIVNGHDDFPLIIAKQRFDGVYDSLRRYWLPQFRAGGVGAAVGAIFTPTVYVPEAALRHALWVLDGLLTEIEENREQIEIARSAADLRRINDAGKIAVLLALEGAEPLGQDLAALRLLHRLGLRMVSLTHARRTLFADGNWENETQGGLSRAGRRAVAEMNRLGIVVDVSHASDRTALDILAATVKPAVASHSNARALCDHPRNLTDETIRAIAATGGVVGAVAVPSFVASADPTIARWADHVEHIVGVAGIDHVGIGADFFRYGWELGAAPGVAESDAGAGSFAVSEFPGMQDAADLPGLTAELRRRGFPEAALRKIYRENLLRVLDAVGA